jgi:Dolichyl-phosphate-mannose-protein mannosyltransferase
VVLMAFTVDKSRWITTAGLVLLVLLGGFLRLHNLDGKSITHVEMYVPGIRLPHGISVPEERLTLLKVVTSTLNSDTHPPAYYALMWFWTKCFGTSAWSVRFPSALFGTACIPLVFWLGVMIRQTAAGWIAAALVAINGHQVFWSQVARMFTLASFLGLLAAILLLYLARQDQSPRWLQFVYVFVLLAGLCTHIFFWMILAAHILWTTVNAEAEKRPMPGALKLQLLAVILGSPLLAFSAYQNGNTLATLSSSTLLYGREFLQFSFAFPLLGYSSGVFADYGNVPALDDPHLSLVRWLFFTLSLILFVAGASMVSRSRDTLFADISGVTPRGWLMASGVATLAIGVFIWVAKTFAHPNPTLRTTERMIILPVLLVAATLLLQRQWQALTFWISGLLRNRLLLGDRALVLILATVPFLALAVVSFFKPIFNARGLVPLGPYLLLVLSAGVVRLARHPATVIAMLTVVFVAQWSGLKAYSEMSAGRANYKAFAAALSPQIENRDLVFIYPEFYSTPLFFYMNSHWDRLVGRNYEVACRVNPHSRIWALRFSNYESQLSHSMEQSFVNYRAAQTVQAPGGQAILYIPNNSEASDSSPIADRQFAGPTE